MMLVKDISLPTPQANILYDDVLFSRAQQHESGEVLRFWESQQYFIVLGRIGKADEDINIEAVKKDNIPVLRRSSGGGTVLQGKGCLNYTLVLSKEREEVRDLKRSYQYILGKVVHVFQSLGVQADFFPISDIALVDGNKKFSGNAQKRGKDFIMHHGTFLVDFDLPLIERYLKIPQDLPEYRHNRSHLEFVTNVHISTEKIKNGLIEAFGVRKNASMDKKEQALLEEYVRLKDVLLPL